MAEARRARKVQRVALHALGAGTVIDAWIDFEDGTGWKRRPAVVVTARTDAVDVVPFTSNLSSPARHSPVRIDDLGHAGLDRATVVLAARCVTLPRSYVLGLRGSCGLSDWRRIVMHFDRQGAALKMPRTATEISMSISRIRPLGDPSHTRPLKVLRCRIDMRA